MRRASTATICSLRSWRRPRPARPADKVAHFAGGTADATHAVRDIDFRRGPNGEGRVVVDLSDPTTGIDIRTEGKNLIVELLKTSLPENLRRRINVVDFATPVQTVSALQQGENVRLVIEPKGQWEHNAYQSESQFVVEVKPVTAEESGKGEEGSLRRREALAQLPERRSARGAERDRGFHRPQHHHQRHSGGQHHAAPEGRALGPGARHHSADARARQPPQSAT